MCSNIRINLDKSIPNTVPNTDSLALGTLAVGLDSFERVTGKKVAYCGECKRGKGYHGTLQVNLHACVENVDWSLIGIVCTRGK